jgi:hypothetical protein
MPNACPTTAKGERPCPPHRPSGDSPDGCATASYQTALAGTDRPGYSYGTATVPLKGAQLEVGYTNSRSGPVTYQTLGEGLLRVGVGPTTELRLFTNSYALRSGDGATAGGIEDAKVGFKQRLWAGKGTAGLASSSIALLAGTSMATGASAFGAGAWQPEAILAASLPVTAKLSFVPNIGDVYAMVDDTRRHRLLGTLAAWYAPSPKWSVFGEYGGSQTSGDAASRLHYLDAGFAIVPLPALQLDLRVGHGMNGVAHDNFVGVGLTRRW